MNRETIYLAGLLHDIGKFWQRAEKPFESADISDCSRQLAGYVCPKNDNYRFGYQHVVWTHEFFERMKSIIEKVKHNDGNVFRVNVFHDEASVIADNLVTMAVYHHKPNTEMQALIQLADWWSSGIDRRPENLEEEGDAMRFGAVKFKKVPLSSIFDSLDIIDGCQNDTLKEFSENNSYRLTPLALDEAKSCFPYLLSQEKIKNLEDDYKQLWEKFVAEVPNLPTDTVGGFCESLYFLLKKYTWCIPSSTRDMANVSLFEHLKSTAAIADCLFEYKNEQPDHFNFDAQLKRLSVKDGVCPLLMVCGDISGIQNFIYNVSSNKAATSLKGRSFYLQLLLESLVQQINIETGAQLGHVIYSSGGKFFMLLPNTESVKESLKKIQASLEIGIWKEHKTRLYASLQWIPFCYQTGERFEDARIFTTESFASGQQVGGLSDLWKAIVDKSTRAKTRKFEGLLSKKEAFFQFFGKDGSGIDLDPSKTVCVVTGEEDELQRFEDMVVSKYVVDQINLGRTLKDADYIITHKNGQPNGISYLSSKSKVNVNPLGLNVQQYLFDQEQLTYDETQWREIKSADTARVRRINNVDFLWSEKLKGQGVSYGFLFYGGNQGATYLEREKNGNTIKREKTFHDLARTDSGNATYLGYLRMDVDGLGKIFQSGLPEGQRTFSAYSTLSSQLDYFFSGWLNTLRNSDEFKDWVNIIYSGGDDLFVVGRWDKTIMFAKAVRHAFGEFIGQKEGLSISGGIVFAHEKFPISLAAEMAGKAEKKAKDFENKFLKNGGKKNAVTIWGEAVSWDIMEFGYVEELKNELTRKRSDGSQVHSKGFIQKLIEFKLLKDSFLAPTANLVNDFSYRWNAAYYLARYAEKFEPKEGQNRKDETLEKLNKLKVKLFTNALGEDRYFDLAGIAARWAEFELREL